MRKFICAAAVCICCFYGCIHPAQKNKNPTTSKLTDMNQENVTTAIIGMEKNALEKLNKGDPSAYLAIYADDITYFDPFQENRIDGIENVRNFYESMQGTINIDHYEMIETVVQVVGETAVLSYNLVSYFGNDIFREKCTEIYCQQPDKQWKIIHSHWSLHASVGE